MNQEEQFKYLKKRADLFFDFIGSKVGNHDLINDFKKTADKAHATSNLTDLKSINHEIDRWSITPCK
ncbi:MAG TPA: hypothetical protein EYN51_06920 [Flavobacteriales bacterium]|nr:hypothetical protein [Flavobacteriales bacterium]